jgi:hypothetical protein
VGLVDERVDLLWGVGQESGAVGIVVVGRPQSCVLRPEATVQGCFETAPDARQAALAHFGYREGLEIGAKGRGQPSVDKAHQVDIHVQGKTDSLGCVCQADALFN